MVGAILEDANNPRPLGIHAVLATHDAVQLLRLATVWRHWQKGRSFPSSQQTQLSSDLSVNPPPGPPRSQACGPARHVSSTVSTAGESL